MTQPTNVTQQLDMHPTLHNFHVNVKMFGATGDGTTDDTAAINAAIAAASVANNGPTVYFPSGLYKITSTINISAYAGLHFLGDGNSLGQGAFPPQSAIICGNTVSPAILWAGTGQSANMTFENLTFQYPGTQGCLQFSDGANLRVKNCAFTADTTANQSVLLENWFWAWFDECAFTSPGNSITKPAVKLRGKEPSPNVDHCYLIRFKDCRFWFNGVLYKDENDIAVDAANVEYITFENIDIESFGATSRLFEVTKTAGTNWGGRFIHSLTFRNIAFYDSSGTAAMCRLDIGTVNGAYVENVTGANRLFQINAGGVKRMFYTGSATFAYPVVDDAGANVAVFGIVRPTDVSLDIHGDTNFPGKLNFYRGTSVGSQNLYASATDTLKTDGSFVIGAGNTASLSLATGGGITIGTDTVLYRGGANAWESTSFFTLKGSGTTSNELATFVSGDNNYRLLVTADGKTSWGPGNATQDANLYRTAANALQSDDVLRQAKGTPTYSASITPDAAAGSWQTITVTNGTAFTINAPTTAVDSTHSQDLTMEIFNNSGGAMGAVTWNAAFVLVGGAFTNPANTKKRFIAFKWNGANWIETSRAGADY